MGVAMGMRCADVLPRRSSMRVATNLGFEVHLKGEQKKEREHHDDARHGGIILDQDIWEARVAEGRESCGYELFSISAKIS